SRCPPRYAQADALASSIKLNATPFKYAAFDDNTRDFSGRVRFRRRLKALSAGTFRFCAYAQEHPLDVPPPFTEAHAFAAFHVAR
ncbi:MAG TPA: hypothetical protein VE127_07245, partial [Solirubrobacteraceae bacterium]|nr:hypothetical protein [Solirubrobacteraceae bacterium]